SATEVATDERGHDRAGLPGAGGRGFPEENPVAPATALSLRRCPRWMQVRCPTLHGLPEGWPAALPEPGLRLQCLPRSGTAGRQSVLPWLSGRWHGMPKHQAPAQCHFGVPGPRPVRFPHVQPFLAAARVARLPAPAWLLL